MKTMKTGRETKKTKKTKENKRPARLCTPPWKSMVTYSLSKVLKV
jgi:hypothetical protein